MENHGLTNATNGRPNFLTSRRLFPAGNVLWRTEIQWAANQTFSRFSSNKASLAFFLLSDVIIVSFIQIVDEAGENGEPSGGRCGHKANFCTVPTQKRRTPGFSHEAPCLCFCPNFNAFWHRLLKKKSKDRRRVSQSLWFFSTLEVKMHRSYSTISKKPNGAFRP
jgi:hypothetical protein